MKSIIFIIVLLVVLLSLFLVNNYVLKRQIKTMPKTDVETKEGFVTKDNIIVVEGLEKRRAPSLIAQLCKMYPAESSSRWEGECFIISYTRGIEFLVFCYIVNYLVYPFDMTKDNLLTVRAWCTTKNIEWGGSNELMLYVPKGDTEYDVTYISTKDGRYFKQMFAIPEPCVIVEELVLPYVERQY